MSGRPVRSLPCSAHCSLERISFSLIWPIRPGFSSPLIRHLRVAGTLNDSSLGDVQAVALSDLGPFETLAKAHTTMAADILMRALAHVPSAYHTVEGATAEVAKLGEEDRLGFAALEGGTLL